MPSKSGVLRINGSGEVEVALVTAFLADLKTAYDSILLFESVIDRVNRASRDFPFPSRLYPYTLLAGWTLSPRRAARLGMEWALTPEEVSAYVPYADQLLLAGVQLASPGFWEFLGKLNPLEVLRQYLNDRHDRRKDRDYRESAENRRMRLENMKLENEIVSGRIRIAREAGATDADLAPLVNELLNKPLLTLDKHQDKGVIEGAVMRQDRESIGHGT